MHNISKSLFTTYFKDCTYPITNVESYDRFTEQLSLLFERHAKKSWSYEDVAFSITLSQPQLQPPKLSPDEAYTLRTSYTVPLAAELHILRNEQPVQLQCNKCVTCELPYMVRYSKQDLGGYFIINGTERVIITQEILCNMPYIVNYSSSADEYYILSGRSRLKLAQKNNGPIYVTKLGEQIVKKKKSEGLHVALLFMAFGVMTLEEATRYCLSQHCSPRLCSTISRLLQLSWGSIPECTTPDAALQLLAEMLGCKERGEAAAEYTRNEVDRACFPYYTSSRHKLTALGLMVYRLVRCSSGERPVYDTHHIGRKRYDRVGNMLTKMMRSQLKKLLSTISGSINRAEKQKLLEAKSAADLVNAGLITNRLCSAVGSGRLCDYEGITQVFNRMNMAAQLCHLSCVQKPMRKESKKNDRPRRFDLKSSIGFFDAHHTPDGSKVGVIVYPTLLSRYSSSRDVSAVWSVIQHLLQQQLCYDSPYVCPDPLLYLNGILKATVRGCGRDTEHIERVVSRLQDAKRSEQLPYDVSIYYLPLDHEIHIWCDENRILRPLLVLPIDTEDSSWLQLSWQELIEAGYIEYVNAFELSRLVVAESIESADPTIHSHCELGALSLMSYSSSRVAYGDSNPACRITYHDAQDKQGISAIPTTTRRGDYHQLWYAQKPLAMTCTVGVMDDDRGDADGVNVIMSVQTFNDFNQEDAIIMNQSSIDRGMFRSFFFKNYYLEEDEQGQLRIIRDDERGNYCHELYGDKSALELDGLPPCGVRILEGQAVIDATLNKAGKPRSAAVIVNRGKGGIVEQSALLGINRSDASGRKIEVRGATVKVRTTCTPKVGDKFSSRHGQKGTVGAVYRQEDLPFIVPDGIAPDIIINPHAVPTRMTAGQFIEAVTALVTCLTGRFFDATPLQSELGRGLPRYHFIQDVLCEALRRHGIQPLANVAMMSGATGELLDNNIFVAPVYYKRLLHLIDNKWHARARGPINSTTHQPTEGRSKKGGLRFGEMERDCGIGSGCSCFINERLSKDSDAHATPICKSCGIFGVVRTREGWRCRDPRCVGDNIVRVCVPYALVLFFKELMSMNITPRIRLKPTDCNNTVYI